jgi:hypothetical protein
LFYREPAAARDLKERSTAKFNEAVANPADRSLLECAQSLANQSALTDAYHRVQLAVGILAATLAPIVAIGYIIRGGHGIHGTISSYEHTNMDDYFVGAVFALGVLFLAYQYKPQDRGYRWDMILSNVASALAVGIALCPTDAGRAGKAPSHTVVGYLHLGFAGALFLLLAIFSLCLFTRTDDPAGNPAHQPKIRRNRWYKLCGWVIVVACALAVVNDLANGGPKLAFVSETVALLAFAGSWLVKCGLLPLPLLSDPAPSTTTER